MRLSESWLVLPLILLLGVSCRTPIQERPEDNTQFYKYSFLSTNKYIRERNRELIIAFADRAGWNLSETPTGLWYSITQPGEGEPVQQGRLVSYVYTTRLLDGTICYRTDTISPKKIVVGKGNVEAGLEEGLLMLREGSSARFVIPP